LEREARVTERDKVRYDETEIRVMGSGFQNMKKARRRFSWGTARVQAR
jgi:hypothetical protein